jgi:hypothetical protein
MFYGIETFRTDLVRFVRLIRTYLHRPIPVFGRLPTLSRQAWGLISLISQHFYTFYAMRPAHGGRNLRAAPPRAEPQNTQFTSEGSFRGLTQTLSPLPLLPAPQFLRPAVRFS